MADKEGRSTEREFNPMIALMGIMIIVVGLFTAGTIAGKFWYQEDPFTATVDSIEFHDTSGGLFSSGSTKTIVRFDDGRAYAFYDIPEIREGQKYTLEYRTPYFISKPYLVIISGGQN